MKKRGPMQLRFIPLFLLVPALAFSAPTAGKVRSVLGECMRQKAKQVKWSDLTVGSSIYQTDRLRTGAESELIFGLADGSTIAISENAVVEMENLLEPKPDGTFDTRLNVEKGFVKFAVKKQKKNSTFKFKSGTATASIRGTDGFVGGGENFFASLATGKLEVQRDEGPVYPIGAGETIVGKDSFVTLKLATSGNPKLAAKISKIMESGKSMDDIVKDVQEADAQVQQELKSGATDSLPENGFILSMGTAVEVCDGSFTVSGAYRTAVANSTLKVKFGSFVSENLVTMADGKAHGFTQEIMVNDENGLWNQTEATVTFVSGKDKDSKSINVAVNATCPGVNRLPPKVDVASYDSVACKANVSIGNMQGDAGILSIAVDGTPSSEEAITKNGQMKMKLQPGIFEYVFTATDQAGNTSSAKKTMGCYPVKRFNVTVSGPEKETIMVPPPPKGMQDRIAKTLQFKIFSPENDTRFLYKVTVKQNGKVILQETNAQILSLDYQVPVELVRKGQNKFDIEVVHKSGFKAKATKRFEVP